MKTQKAIERFLYNRECGNRKPKTIEWYRERLSRFACSYPKLPKRPEPIEEFLLGVKGAPETRHGYFRVLRAFYGFASIRFHFRNPMEQVTAPSCPKKVMASLELQEMISLVKLTRNLRDEALLTVLVDTGARVSEVLGLRRQDIKEDSITVNGKTGEREIPISPETRGLLLNLIANNGNQEWVFCGQRGQLTRYGAYILIHKLMRKAGIRGSKLGPHRIRHGFGKNYLMDGGDLRSLQEIMGHSNISTTEKYASLNLNDLQIKHHKFTPLRAVHAAAQRSLFDSSSPVIEEAEAILAGNGISLDYYCPLCQQWFHFNGNEETIKHRKECLKK